MISDDPAQPRFRVLGTLGVTAPSSTQVEISPGRQSIVLAVLLLNVNLVVGSDRLIDLVWPSEPPATARTQIQICVSELRKKLARAGYDHILKTRRPGYVIELPDADLDHRLFATRVARSRLVERDPNRLAEAAELLLSALALWRGPPLEGLAEGLQSHVAQLEEQRTSAFESLIDLQLQLGEHVAVVAGLMRMIERHPLRERPYAQLMTALLRSGRRAEALDVYQTARSRLVDQLGIEPGSQLQAVHDEVLAGSSGGPVPARPPIDEPVVEQVADPIVRPFQLPSDTADFGGRDEVCSRVIDALTGSSGRIATPVVVLAGKPGVGKSAVAIHVARRVRDQFPDGQFYCELGGSGRPVEVGEVLARFVRAMGAPGSTIPDGVTERADLYRTLIAGRRMLIVLEDVGSQQQVRALLPGAAHCAVLVTSRTMLTDLPGAVMHDLDVLDADRARQLLARVVGQSRIDAEPAVADALVRMVGGLPLALRIVAARLAARPNWPLTVMMERLEDERHRLDELSHGELMMRASLAMSYDGLPQAAGRLLRLLSMLDMSSYPVWVAAALVDCPENVVARLMELLVDVHLLEIAALDLDGSPRYRFHVIIRLFAREQMRQIESRDEQLAALSRVGRTWLGLTDEVHRRLYGGDYLVLRSPVARRMPEPRRVEKLLFDPLAWLESERASVCSFIATTAEPETAEMCWDLTVTMVDLFESGSWFDDWAATHEVALRVTERCGDCRGEAAVLASLGTLHLTRGRVADALAVLHRSLVGFEAVADAAGTALVRRELAWAARLNGDVAAATEGYRAALAGFESVGDPIGRAHVLGRLADIELETGRPDSALALLQQALALCEAAGNHRVEIQTLFRISTVNLQQGHLDEAQRHLPQLLERVRARHDVIGEAKILQQLGTIRLEQGDAVAALPLLREAVTVRRRSPDQAGIESLFATLGRAQEAAPWELPLLP